MSVTSRFRVAFLLLCLLWLGTRLIWWNGFYTEDAPGYVTDAAWAALGNYHARDNVNGLNIGTYLPVAVPLRLFGKSEVALGLWSLTSSLIGLVSLTGTSRIFLGRGFGLLAALLYATYPGDIFFSTVVMPDALQAGWFSLAIFLIVRAFAGSPSRRRRTLVGSGVAMGVCHLIRASDVLLVPVGVFAVALCAILWHGERAREVSFECGSLLAGWAAVVTAEGLVYAWAAGDFLHRARVVTAHYGTMASIARAGLNTDALTIPFSLFAPILWIRTGGWWEFNPEQAYHGLLFVWAVLSLAVAAGVLLTWPGGRDRRLVTAFAVAVTWMCWPLLYQQFGSQSLTQFVPIHRLSRHLVVDAPAAVFATVTGCAIGVALLQRLMTTRSQRLVLVLAGAILFFNTYLNARAEGVAYRNFHRIKDSYVRILAHLPGDVPAVIADPGDLCFLDFWMNPLGSEPVRMVPFSAISACAQINEGVVLTQSNPGWHDNAPAIREAVSRLPCLAHPPDTWRQIYEGYPEKVFRITPRERHAGS